MVATEEQIRAVVEELEETARQRLEREPENELRSAKRIPLHQVMRLADAREAEASTDWSWRPMLSLDVSRAGLGLVSANEGFELGRSVVVNCFPGRAEQMCIPGRVVRMEEFIPGLYTTGIEFQFSSELAASSHMK